MSTRATEALVQAPQSGVARGAQAHGKRSQQAELGKNGSAGFAQILGEQVAQSTPQTDTLAKSSQRFVSYDVPTSPPNTTPTPQAPPSVSPPPQALPHRTSRPTADTGEKTVPQVRAQIHLERSEHTPPATSSALAEKPRHGDDVPHPMTDPAPRVRGGKSWPQTEAGTANRAPALPAQETAVLPGAHDEATRTVEQKAQPTSHASLAPMATLAPAKSLTAAHQSKDEAAALPAARIGQTVAKLTGRSESPAQLVIAPNSESRSTIPVQARVEPDHTQPAHAQDTVRARESTQTVPGSSSPTRTADGQMVTAMATPTESTGTPSTVQSPGRHVETPLPPVGPAPEAPRSRHAITHEGQNAPSSTSFGQVAVGLPQAPSPVLMSAPIREQMSPQSSPINPAPHVPVQPGDTVLHLQPAATDNSPRVSIKAHDATAPAAPSTGQADVFTPAHTGTPALHAPSAATDDSPRVSIKAHDASLPAAPKTSQPAAFTPLHTGTPALHGKSSASENTTRSPSPSLPAIPPAGLSTFSVVPPSVGNSVHKSTLPAPTAHGPNLESLANLPQPHTVDKTFDATPAPRQASARVLPLAAKATAQAPAAKPGAISTADALVVGESQAQEPPHPMPATAPPTTTPALSPKGPANLAADVPAHAHKESASGQMREHSGQHTVTDANPAQEPKPQTRPDSGQAPVVAQRPSPSIPLPNPVTVAQESAAPPLARNPHPVSPPDTAHPMAAAQASANAAAARPVSGHPGVVEDVKSAQSTARLKTPEPDPNRVLTSSEDGAPAPANKPAVPGPETAGPLPAPAAPHAATKSAVHAPTLVSKQRTHVEDKKEPEETTEAPTTSPQVNPRPSHVSHASPSATVEVTVAKAEAAQTPEHTNTAPASSQNTSAQSTASQPHAAKEQLHPVVLTAVEHPTAFVPPTTLLSTHGDASIHEAPAPSPVAAETAGLVDRAVQDPGLSVTVMPHSAHVSIAGDTGDLSLHVRVRDGSADVNVSGTMAPLFDTKAPEMRTALASEGLQLGSFATDQRGGSQGQQGQPESTPRTNVPQSLPPPRQPNTSTPEVQIAADQRIHVTA